jgi:transposase-like protein
LDDHDDDQFQDGTLGPAAQGRGGDPQVLRDGLRLLAQELMDAEVIEAIGAVPHERTAKRVTSHNGVREWDLEAWGDSPGGLRR